MTINLLSDTWASFDYVELRYLLAEYIGRPGQYDGDSQNKLYLPLAGSSCQIILTFRNKKIIAIEPGPAFNATDWKRISTEIEIAIVNGSDKVGREYSFSSFRVLGSWKGETSGIQILPAPDDTPRADVEIAEHPFILEFPMRVSSVWYITNTRRLRTHRNLTLLLNALLAGHTSLQPRRSDRFWANVSSQGNQPEIRWVQRYFFAQLGESIIESYSLPANNPIEVINPEEYYQKVGHDGKGLRIPANLDQFIYTYLHLSEPERTKFDRALFWLDMASQQWSISVSTSFASLVSALESLTDRGEIHRVYCDLCKEYRQHEVPGATERFRALLEQYAPGTALRSRRSAMYALRSGILHGSDLMQLDQDLQFDWDPPWWNERELHDELWSLTRVTLRNWLESGSKNT